MNLPKLSLAWGAPELIKALIECLRQIEAADRRALKTGTDIEVAGARLILTDTADGARYAVEIAGGTLTLTPL